MRISVVIATYNRAPLLQAALESLRQQQYDAGDEVIVVDNGSSDATRDVISRAAAGFPVPLHYLHESTPGKTPAMNAGIALARGDILALTDDDVLVSDDWIATIRRLFADDTLALVGGRVEPWWERPAPAWLQLQGHGRYGAMASPLALLHYGEAQELGGRTAVGANMSVRRSVHDALGGFAPHLGRRRGTLLCGEDHDFCLRATAAGYRCEYQPALRVRHWVPAERIRLSYYLRWFFWSGVTNALMDAAAGRAGGRRVRALVPLRLLRPLVTAFMSAVLHLATRRTAKAAAQAMEVAYVAGYIWHCVGPDGGSRSFETGTRTPATGVVEFHG